jgi:hypothetical protein
MNRADKMLSVLKDGRTYSRLEIFERVGFMLTNNAASELRAQGFEVEHRKEHGNDVYRLVGRLDEAATQSPSTACLSSSPRRVAASSSTSPNQLPQTTSVRNQQHGSLDEDVLQLFGDAA